MTQFLSQTRVQETIEPPAAIGITDGPFETHDSSSLGIRWVDLHAYYLP